MSLLPLAMRMGDPREAVWHAIIRKNYGCTHLIVGRDHAGPGSDSSGQPFYGPYEAQELLQSHEQELGMNMVPFKMMAYVANMDKYIPIDEVPERSDVKMLSGTELRERLATGREIPAWFSFPDVVKELRCTYAIRLFTSVLRSYVPRFSNRLNVIMCCFMVEFPGQKEMN